MSTHQSPKVSRTSSETNAGRTSEESKGIECNICYDVIVINNVISCPYCQEECCLTCFKNYILSIDSEVPDCFSCKKELSLDFISSVTSNNFHNKIYRDKRANFLFSKEKSLLPATQEILGVKIERERELDELSRELRELQTRARVIHERIAFLEDKEKKCDYSTTKQVNVMMNCNQDDCRGFVSDKWKCGTCETYFCAKCRGVKNGMRDENHVCNKDDVETYKLLKKDTKPCPKCNVLIHYIDGCDQMWCTQCHTTFSWKTGKIVKGRVHNPHYFEWLRSQSKDGEIRREDGDNPCGNQVPTYWAITRLLPRRCSHKTQGIVLDAYRMITHITEYELVRYPTEMSQKNNLDLRCRFLKNEISEKKWFSMLKMRQKKTEKNVEINQIFTMLAQSLRDIFIEYAEQRDLDVLLATLENIRLYVNESLEKVKLKYKNQVPMVSEIWTIIKQ
jgi:hypothetical protein